MYQWLFKLFALSGTNWFYPGIPSSFLRYSGELPQTNQDAIKEDNKINKNKPVTTRDNFTVKAKRGRPPSKPPTEELIKKRRKVWIFYVSFFFWHLSYVRPQMPEKRKEWSGWTKLSWGLILLLFFYYFQNILDCDKSFPILRIFCLRSR